MIYYICSDIIGKLLSKIMEPEFIYYLPRQITKALYEPDVHAEKKFIAMSHRVQLPWTSNEQ